MTGRHRRPPPGWWTSALASMRRVSPPPGPAAPVPVEGVDLVADTNDFYEDDEPVERLLAIMRHPVSGSSGFTGPGPAPSGENQ